MKGSDGSGQGNKKCKTSTIKRYQATWNPFLHFLIALGDYESAIILYHPEHRTKPLPVSDISASIYLRYRVLEPGTIVQHPVTQEPVKLTGPGQKRKILKACGDWKSVTTIGIFRSAISGLHKMHDECQGPYIEPCRDCRQISPKNIERGHSCRLHSGSARYWRKGNVITSELFRGCKGSAEEYCETNYESRRTVALLPGDLRKIRDRLLSENTVHHLMLWCIIILGVKLFLRVHEVLKLRMDSFVERYSVVRGEEVVAICVKIKGKREKKFKYFLIIDDKDCPDLSPVRDLLIYIGTTGRRGGYLFPELSQLFSPNPTKHYTYNYMLSDMKYLVIEVCRKVLNGGEGVILIVGTHILRKTAFLLAYWGKRLELSLLTVKQTNYRNLPLPPEDISCILLDARHENAISTATYLQDAATLCGIHLRLALPDSKHKVGRYQPIYLHTPSSMQSIVSNDDTSKPNHIMLLPDLATWFIKDVMGTQPEIVLQDNVRPLCDKALTLYSETPDSMEELLRAFQSFLPKALCDKAVTLFEKLPQEIHQEGQELQLRPVPEPHVVARQREYLQPTEDWQALFNAARTPIGKLDVIIRACEDIRNLWIECPPEPGLKSWVYKAGRIASCIEVCHNGSPQRLLECCGGKVALNYKCPRKQHTLRRK